MAAAPTATVIPVTAAPTVVSVAQAGSPQRSCCVRPRPMRSTLVDVCSLLTHAANLLADVIRGCARSGGGLFGLAHGADVLRGGRFEYGSHQFSATITPLPHAVFMSLLKPHTKYGDAFIGVGVFAFAVFAFALITTLTNSGTLTLRAFAWPTIGIVLIGLGLLRRSSKARAGERYGETPPKRGEGLMLFGGTVIIVGFIFQVFIWLSGLNALILVAVVPLGVIPRSDRVRNARAAALGEQSTRRRTS